MLNFCRLVVCGLLVFGAPLVGESLVGQSPVVADELGSDKSLEISGEVADRFPEKVLAYAEVRDLNAAIEIISNHPIKDRVISLPAYDSVRNSVGLQQLQGFVKGFEATMEQPWQDAIATLTAGGVGIGLDRSGGVSIVIESSDAESTEKLRNLLLALLPKKGGALTPKKVDYRGVTAYELKDVLLAQLDRSLMITNNPKAGKAMVDHFSDPDAKSLSKLPNFQAARKLQAEASNPNSNRLVTAFLDLQSVRDARLANEVFNERIDNIVGELILGGVLTTARNTPYLTATFDLSQRGVELQVRSPHDRQWEPPREYQFGEDTIATAPPLIEIDSRMFAVSTHRDLSQMWLRSGDLVSDRAVDEMAKADAQLSIFFSGRDFGEEILGSFGPGVQLVGRVPEASEKSNPASTDQALQPAIRLPEPAIKLPEFALQFEMQESEMTQPELRRVFQSFIGFLNVTSAMNGNPQLDLGTEEIDTNDGTAKLIMSTFVPNQDEAESDSAPIQFNFSPTLAFSVNRVVISSSTALARELVRDQVELARHQRSKGSSEGRESKPIRANTVLKLEGAALQKLMRANQSQLVARNMLSKGQTKQEAEAEIGLLLELIGYLEESNISLEFDETQMVLSAQVTVK